jgi:predicted MPP superfamily phosphohydrolase
MALTYGLIETADLPIPHLPPSLEGLRVAQLTDLHITKRARRWHSRMINQLAALRLDLLVLTGDYMHNINDEPATMQLLGRLLERIDPKVGSFGVFGNHDTQQLRQDAANLPVQWLSDTSLALPDHPIDILGFNVTRWGSADSVALALDAPPPCPDQRLRMVLSHYPRVITTAADLGADVMFAGHSHGGQIRLPGRRALVNSSDLPLGLTAGIMRHRQTLLAVSRGLGTAGLPLRLFCQPHIPIYTLRRGPRPGQHTDQINNISPW